MPLQPHHLRPHLLTCRQGVDQAVIDILAGWVTDEYTRWRPKEGVTTSDWVSVPMTNIPRQHNDCDCGVFALQVGFST